MSEVYLMHVFDCDSKIVFGKGVIYKVKEFSKGRAAIVTTRSLLYSNLLKELNDLVKGEIVVGPKQHATENEVRELAQKLVNYDTVISLGGGSIIDSVKLAFNGLHIAIPTTYSGAENTTIAGFTRDGLKVGSKTRRVNVIILDSLATHETPIGLLRTSGVRAIDHSIEALYSPKSNPLSDSLAIEGYNKLIKCLINLGDEEERLNCFIGSFLSSRAMELSGRGLSHIFGYVFGPRFNIPHGVTSCISLVKSIQLNYDFIKGKLKYLERNPLDFLNENYSELCGDNRLSNYVKKEEALNLVPLLTQMVNNSENPRKLSEEEVRKFVESLY